MSTISIKDAKNRLTEIARQVEATGEAVTITRNGKPILDLVPHRRKGGVNFEAGKEFLRLRGIDKFFEHVAADFDEPLPEDFLLRPLPR
jgi:prevent-host-death family protein